MHRSVLAALVFTGCALGGEPSVTWDLQGLPRLAEGSAYELWLVTPTGVSASLGQIGFDEEGNLDRTEATVTSSLAQRAERFLLTIEDQEEPPDEDAPFDVGASEDEPGNTVVLAGELLLPQDATDMSRRAELTMREALGVDLAEARGGYVMQTYTTETTGDYDQGVWFLIPGDGPALDLPDLPQGWVYEGWVLTGPLPALSAELRSTGVIFDVASADSDGPGPAAGDLRAPAYPGQDFIDPPLTVAGARVMISLEPDPDDDPGAPFLLSVLHDLSVDDVGPEALQYLENAPEDAMPTGEVTIEQ